MGEEEPATETDGDEWRAALSRQRDEADARHREWLRSKLASLSSPELDPAGLVDVVFETLFVVRRVEGGDQCRCSCHPQLPTSDLHDFGFDCPCQRTAAERRAWWDAWTAERDAYWASPEGLAASAARQSEEDELKAWVEGDAGIDLSSHGGWAPEQWEGTVDGHSFYFRERHDDWRIELDLRPTGQQYRALVLGEDGSKSEEMRDVERGDVIAEGTVGVPGYGRTPVERMEFLARTIRAHLKRQHCDVHTDERGDLELLLGRALRWCPDCGQEL